ncbi:CsbD family protein [Streptomyces sp. NPDC008265]|uniref:CsbD family protein n=1 Tax=Streptomyces sp. NPDC008265 TaxID=3364824 RepID=UPI0036EC7501
MCGARDGAPLPFKLKETVGRLTGNERLTAEGRAEQVEGDARQAKEKIKDTFKH